MSLSYPTVVCTLPSLWREARLTATVHSIINPTLRLPGFFCRDEAGGSADRESNLL
jgi:hypothetical protein